MSFSEASRRLFVTQGAISQQIKLLEEELDNRLFIRKPHSVVLTEAGQELLPMAERTLQDAEACRTHMVELRKLLSGTLNAGLTHSFGGLFSDTVKEFLKKYPGVNLKIYYKPAAELYEMLVKGDIDFFIAFKPAQLHADVESEELFSTRLSAVMRKDNPLAERKSLSLKDLERHGVALPGSGLQARKAFEKFVNVDTSGLNVKVEANDPDIIMDLVETTNLITILSGLAVHYRPGLVAIPLDGIERQMLGCVHWLKNGYHKRSAEAFIELLRDSAQLKRLLM